MIMKKKFIRCAWNGSKRLRRKTRGIWNREENPDHFDFRIVLTGWSTEKSPINTMCQIIKIGTKKTYMKVTLTPIVIGAFGTVIKYLLRGMEVLEIGG